MKTMKRCPQCGRRYEEPMVFCLDDGVELEEISVPAGEVETIVRPRTTTSSITDPVLPEPSNPWKFGFIALLSVIGLALVGGIFAMLLMRDDRDITTKVNTSLPAGNEINLAAKTPTPTPTPISNANANVIANANTNTNTAAASTPLPSVTDRLKKGTPYADVRSMILNEGWTVPREPSDDNGPGATYLRDMLRYNEVRSCAGTGLGQCRLEFTDNKGRTLYIITLNNDDSSPEGPTVDSWGIESN